MSKTKQLLDDFIKKRSKGIELLEKTTKFKLLLKGINYDLITEDTEDDPKVRDIIIDLADKLNVKLDQSLV